MGFLHREHVPVILPHPTWVATSPGEESPALEKPPYAQPCRASLVHRSCFPPFSQLAANASGATDQVIPQNCSSSLPLTQLLPGSPSPLKSAQRRLLLAICCQRLEKPNINTAANAYSSFPPPPPPNLGSFPSPAAIHPHPPLFWEPAMGLSRGVGGWWPAPLPGLAAHWRERAARDARLSKILRKPWPRHRSHTQYPQQPQLWSYSAAISMQLEMRSRDYCPGNKETAKHIYTKA